MQCIEAVLRGLVALAVVLAGAGPAAAEPDQARVTIAVGGKPSLYYLPLTLAERLGYFTDEGLQVEIVDFAGGAKALQAMMGGSADVVCGGFDHVVLMRAKGQKLKAFALQVATPALSLGIATKLAANYRSPKDLKGMKIGVSAPGSSTHIFVNHLLASAGLAPDDVSIIGVGTGPAAAAAMQAGHLDAIANIEPTMTLLEESGAIRVMVETVSVKGATAVFGTPLPAGSLYTREEFVKSNPGTVQALTNAMVRSLKWLQKAGPDEVAATVPPEYLAGDRKLYLAGLRKMRESYSKDGLYSPAAVSAQLKVLAAFEPSVRDAAMDPAAAYTNEYVNVALRKYK
ncbi:MAG TPA: ABC transporter substrate-binding protein [Burkholderiales bacterium]|nr:ABC transporter substrate-binding protein [Burkholderiales bacterium]